VVGDIFPAAAQGIDALCEQGMDRVRDAGGTALVGKRGRRRAGQADALVGTLEQQYPGIAAEVATIKRCFDNATSELAQDRRFRRKFNGTIWHRRFQLLLGGRTNNNALRHGIAHLPHEISGLAPDVCV
jgi:hypothetical protein